MIDILFLNKPIALKSRSGMEFLDWQKNNFFQELIEAVKETYNKTTNTLELSKADRNNIKSIIKKYSNLNVTIQAETSGNLSIDVGFISPNSVLNIPGLDFFIDKKYTKVSEAYSDLRKNTLKGYCDLRTGKVEGDFKHIEFNMRINVNLPETEMSKSYIKESGVTVYEAIAAGILHECGHAFFGLHYLSSSIIDNAMMAQSVKMLINEPDKNRKVVIIKDIKSNLDVDIDEETASNTNDGDTITVLFEKGLINRDYRRTLSLGVTEMTPEVLADAYAIRMGASYGLMGLIGAFYNKSNFWGTIKAIIISLLLIYFKFFSAVGVFVICYILTVKFMRFFSTLVAGNYDSNYRRLKTILRDNIAYLQSNPKGFTKEQTTKMISDTKQMEQLVNDQKSFFESTALQRALGFIFNGSDFRKTDFEHYTAEITHSNLFLYKDLFTNKD